MNAETRADLEKRFGKETTAHMEGAYKAMSTMGPHHEALARRHKKSASDHDGLASAYKSAQDCFGKMGFSTAAEAQAADSERGAHVDNPSPDARASAGPKAEGEGNVNKAEGEGGDIAKVLGELGNISKAMNALVEGQKALDERLKKVEAQPEAPKGPLRVVDKSADAHIPAAVAVDLEKMNPEDRAFALMKQAHGTGARSVFLGSNGPVS